MLKEYLRKINIEPNDEILGKFEKFTDLLLEWNEKINLTAITEENDIIVKNMLNAILFIVKEKPAFNKENLRKLYDILSKDCLAEEILLFPM